MLVDRISARRAMPRLVVIASVAGMRPWRARSRRRPFALSRSRIRLVLPAPTEKGPRATVCVKGRATWRRRPGRRTMSERAPRQAARPVHLARSASTPVRPTRAVRLDTASQPMAGGRMSQHGKVGGSDCGDEPSGGGVGASALESAGGLLSSGGPPGPEIAGMDADWLVPPSR